MHPGQPASRQVQLSHAGAGGNQQTVIGKGLAVGEGDPARRTVDGLCAAACLHLDLQRRQLLRVEQARRFRAHRLGQELLGQRRPLVRQLAFLADQGDGAPEAGLARRLRRPQAGLAGPEDHQGALRRRCRCGRRCRRGRSLRLRSGLRRASGVDVNGAVLDLHGIGRNVFADRRALGLAGADVEKTLVQRTFDAAVLDIAVRKQRKLMGADISGGENFAIQGKERHPKLVQLQRKHPLLLDFGCRCGTPPSHPLSLSFPAARSRPSHSSSFLIIQYTSYF